MRIRLKFRKQTNIEQILFYIALLCVSSFALLEHASISLFWISPLKWPMLYVAAVCVLSQYNLIIRTFTKKKYFYIWLGLLAFCLAMMISAYVNRNPVVGANPIRNSLRTSLFMIEMYILAIWAAEKRRAKNVLKFLFHYCAVLAILTDALLLYKKEMFYGSGNEAYLLGTKFTVSYLHMNLLVLWGMQDQRRIYLKSFPKLRLLVLGILPLFISLRVGCVTSTIGCIVLLILLFFVDTRTNKRIVRFFSPGYLLILLTVSLGFPFVSEGVVSIPFVRSFIVDFLGKSENLTGRTNIFNIFGEQMMGHWLWGYGMGNGNAAAMKMFNYANAQNAQLQWILQGGLITAAALVLLMVMIFRQAYRSDRFRLVLPLVMLIYVYIVLGMVEITFSMSFLMWVILIFMIINEAPEPVTLSPVENA